MEIIGIVIILGIIGLFINQSALNKKLNDVYTEVEEIHNKMGGWFEDQD
jgi:hypothetical protein